MIKLVPKQKRQIILASSKEKFIYVFKYIMLCPGTFKFNKNIEISTWKYLIHFHSYYKAITSLSLFRNICVFTGRAHGLYRSFKISRMQIREKIKKGFFFGISKSSW